MTLQLRADSTRVWQLAARATYQSTDLAAIAVREMLQNAIDAVRSALRRKMIEEGRIDIRYNRDTHELSCSDNGIGMNAEILEKVFLVLGGTTKQDEEANIGGFGIAKAAILGCARSWEIRTQNLVMRSEMLGVAESFEHQPFQQGCTFILHNVADNFNTSTQIQTYLAASTFPSEIVVTYNGRRVNQWFTLNRPKKLWLDLPESVTMRVYVLKRKDKSTGQCFVRLNKLHQYTTWLDRVPADIVVDVTTTAKAGTDEYPFASSREELRGDARRALEFIRQQFAENPLSSMEDDEYRDKVYRLDDTLADEVAEAEDDDDEAEDVAAGFTGLAALATAAEHAVTPANNTPAFGVIGSSGIVKSDVEDSNPLDFPWALRRHRDFKWRFDARKYMKLLVLWRAAVRLVGKANKVSTDELGVGFVLQPNLVGQKCEIDNRIHILFNPKYHKVKGNRAAPLAAMLLNTAAHELAHVEVGGHNEMHTSLREDYFRKAADQYLEDMIELVKVAKRRD